MLGRQWTGSGHEPPFYRRSAPRTEANKGKGGVVDRGYVARDYLVRDDLQATMHAMPRLRAPASDPRKLEASSQ
jgi:hypothetical protein